MDLQKLIQDLERGKESAHQIKNISQKLLLLQQSSPSPSSSSSSSSSDGCDSSTHDHDQKFKGLDDHSKVVLTTFDNALSMLQSSSCHLTINDFITSSKPSKIARLDGCDHSSPQSCKSEESGMASPHSTPNTPTSSNKDKRGCYKRRRNGKSVVLVLATLTDDGFGWRKYGQKTILNTTYPRNYYRCTHKHEQGCLATKQVQQISENPTKFRVIYQGDHICKNLLKNPSINLLDSEDYHQGSSIFMNFETNTATTNTKTITTAKQALNPFSIFSSSTLPMVKQEYESIKKEIQSGPHDQNQDHDQEHGVGVHVKQQYSSSSDLTTTGVSMASTPVSEQGDDISPAEVCSSTATYMVEDYSKMMADPDDFNEFFHMFGGCL